MTTRRNIQARQTPQPVVKVKTTRMINSKTARMVRANRAKEKPVPTVTAIRTTRHGKQSLLEIMRKTNLSRLRNALTGGALTTSLGACTKPRTVASRPTAVTTTTLVIQPLRALPYRHPLVATPQQIANDLQMPLQRLRRRMNDDMSQGDALYLSIEIKHGRSLPVNGPNKALVQGLTDDVLCERFHHTLW
jgi:hypothetical protein